MVTRLPGTLAPLEAGELTTYQARAIAEPVAPLDDTAAAEVGQKAIGKSELYAGQSRAAVQRAVLAAARPGSTSVAHAPAPAAAARAVGDRDGSFDQRGVVHRGASLPIDGRT